MSIVSMVKGIGKTIAGFTYDNLPKILAVGGGGLLFGGTVDACVTCVKHATIVQEAQRGLQSLDAYWDEIRASGEPNSYTLKDYKKDKREIIFTASLDFGKHLVRPVAELAAGGLCIGAAIKVLDERFATTAALLDFAVSNFAQYRENVIADQGKEADERYLRGTGPVVDVETGEMSKEVMIVGDNNRVDPPWNAPKGDIYTFYFRRGNKYWDDNPYYNVMFLINEQRTLNNDLQINKSIFRSEVVKALGGTVESGDLVYPRDNMVGWKIGNGDNCVDFGIFDANKDLKPWVRAYMQAHDDVIPIRLNCDGNILKKLSEEKR